MKTTKKRVKYSRASAFTLIVFVLLTLFTVIQQQVPVVFAATILVDGFEGGLGNFTVWNPYGGLQTDPHASDLGDSYQADYSLHCVPYGLGHGCAVLYNSTSNYTTVYSGAFVRFNSFPVTLSTSSSKWNLLDIHSSDSWSDTIGIYVVNNTIGLFNNPYGEYSVTHTLNLHQWYWVEVFAGNYPVSNSSLWIDDVLISDDVDGFTDPYNMTSFGAYWAWYGFNVNIDYAMVSTTYISKPDVMKDAPPEVDNIFVNSTRAGNVTAFSADFTSLVALKNATLETNSSSVLTNTTYTLDEMVTGTAVINKTLNCSVNDVVSFRWFVWDAVNSSVTDWVNITATTAFTSKLYNLDHVFTVKNNGYDRYGAVVVYPFKTMWNGKRITLSTEDVLRIARAHGKRRELSDKVDVVDLIFNKALQIYIATYGHIDGGLK